MLIVEDELIVALNLSKELESLGYEVTGLAASEDEAVALAGSTDPHVILMDINLEAGGSGLSAAAKIGKTRKIPIIYVTAYSSDKVIELAGKTNPYGYILKPYNVREVKAVISTALIRLRYENKINESEKRLKLAMQAAELEVFEFDYDEQSVSLTQHNSTFAQYGFSKDMSKCDFLALFIEKDAIELDNLLSLRKPFNRRARLKTKDAESQQYLDVYLSQIHYKTGKVQIGAVQDVTYDQKNIDRLKISDSVLQQMQESVLVLDENELIQQSNPAFCQLVGYSESEIKSRPISDFLLRERKEDISVVKTTQGKSDGRRLSEVTVKCIDDSLVHAMMTVSTLRNVDEAAQLVITLTDISRLVEAERSLHKIAFTDALTGFGNRAYLNRLLRRLNNSIYFENVALFFIDIDSFKGVNDSYGHEFGDKVLVEFARRLISAFRDGDHLVRIGGDEFVAILTGVFDHTALEHIGQKVLDLFSADFYIDQQHFSVTSSLGIAYSSKDDFKPEELLKQADSAMYHAKKTGKNTYKFFDKTLAEQSQYRIFIEQGLKAAIRDNIITVYLQPIVNAKGEIRSVEALCRWYDSNIGYISPGVFIPVAEESSLIHSLGFKVINESMVAKKQLNEAGFGHIVVNINFSEKQLQNNNTYIAVCELLEQYELNANEFVIEITESILHRASSDKTIKLLKDKGFKFALDDFGTGYSSLSRLHDYSVDVVKIDKSFVDHVCSNTKQNVITHSIIQLGQKLGYSVVAEGVESEQQRDMLISLGCDKMQGFYFDTALPMHELLKRLR